MVVSDTDFNLHQTLISSGYLGFQQAEDCLLSGVNLVVASTDLFVEIDLLDAYNTNMQLIEQNKLDMLRGSTQALINHCSTRTGKVFDDYLSTRGLKVSPQFALLAESVGTTVSPENIQ